MSKVFFETVTVKKVDEKADIYFSELVGKIENRKRNHQSTNSLEDEIESELNKLYNLSSEEVEILKRGE